jgi:hypothetical protein
MGCAILAPARARVEPAPAGRKGIGRPGTLAISAA